MKKVTLKNCEEIVFPKIKLSENIAIWVLNRVAKNDHAVLLVIKVLENSQENMHGVVQKNRKTKKKQPLPNNVGSTNY